MKEMKTLTLNGEQYKITDGDAARIDDTAGAESTTWSGQKISGELGNVESRMLATVTPMIDRKVDDAYTDMTSYVTDRLNAYHNSQLPNLKETYDLAQSTRDDLDGVCNDLAEIVPIMESTAEKLDGLIDDSSHAADKTLSAKYIYEMFSYTDQLHTNWLRSRVDDTAVSKEKTWSSQKLSTELGNVASALDSILAMQNALIGGDSV